MPDGLRNSHFEYHSRHADDPFFVMLDLGGLVSDVAPKAYPATVPRTCFGGDSGEIIF